MQKTIKQTFKISPHGGGLTLENLGVIKTRDIKTVRFDLDFIEEDGHKLSLDDKRVYAYVTLGEQQYVLESEERSGLFLFDTAVIQRPCKVRVDVYIEQGEESVDAGAFVFQADISTIDKDIDRILTTEMPSLGGLLQASNSGVSERIETEHGWYYKLGKDLVLMYQSFEIEEENQYTFKFDLDLPIEEAEWLKYKTTPQIVARALNIEGKFTSFEEVAEKYAATMSINFEYALEVVESYILEIDGNTNLGIGTSFSSGKIITQKSGYLVPESYYLLGVINHEKNI